MSSPQRDAILIDVAAPADATMLSWLPPDDAAATLMPPAPR